MQLSTIDTQPLHSVDYISDEVIDVFNGVVTSIFPKLPTVDGSLSFVSQVERSPRFLESIRHDDLEKFNSAYFLRNCLKCLIALDETKAFKISDVMDVGCGVGTAAIAWLMMRQEFGLHQSVVECVDRSPSQLRHAQNLIQASGLNESLASYRSNVHRFDRKNVKLSILSYCLCEMYCDGISNFNKVSSLSGENLLIDYHQILLNFLKENSDLFTQYILKTSVYILPPHIASLLNKKAMKVSYLYAKKAS